jgi:uncharacterized protein (TIGR03000 family)
MKKFLLIVAIAAMAVLADSQLASAGRRGCGGGRRGGHGGCGGCGGYVSCGYGGGCGYSHGGCGAGGCGGYVGHVGGCSTCGGGHVGGGYVGGCSTCGISGGYVGGSVGGCATCSISGGVGTCPGGVCTVGGSTTVAQADVNAAMLVVTLPEDAQLTIGDEETTSTSTQRVFVSPTLEAGKQYEYTLKAKVLRDGKIQTATRKVTVRPGEVSNVELKLSAASVAAQ